MKNKKILFVSIILIVIFVFFIILINVDYQKKNSTSVKKNLSEQIKENSVFDFESAIEVKNFKFEKKENKYLLSFDLTAKEENTKKYNLYLLDKNKNLLYTFNDIVLDSEVGYTKPHRFYISYDISSLDKIVVMEQTKKLDYKKDISDTLIYIGDTSNDQNLDIKIPLMGN